MSSSAHFLARKLRALDAELPKEMKRVATNADDEAVHDLRVTIRRLRIVLKLARPVFGRFHTDAVRDAFAAAQRATGDLRDEEALEETFEKVEPEGAHANAAKTWMSKRATRKRQLHRGVTAVISSGELRRARTLLAALLTLPVKPKKEGHLERLARKSVERARRDVEDHRDAASDDVEALHELRIAYKGLRYTIETFEEVLPADLRALRDPAVKMQKILGDIHDVDVAIATLERTRNLEHDVRHHMKVLLLARRAEKIAAFENELHPEPHDHPLFI